MLWARLLVGAVGLLVLALGGFFGWLTRKTWGRDGWSDKWSRAYLLTRTVSPGIAGVALLVGAIFRLREFGYVVGGALLAGGVIYSVIGRHWKREERKSRPVT